MNRIVMIATVGNKYLKANIENGEFSYPKAFREKSISFVPVKEPGTGRNYEMLDIRFEIENVSILIETKDDFTLSKNKNAEKQLSAYVSYEKKLTGNKVIAILANTNDNKIKVWKDKVDDEHFLKADTVLNDANYYKNIFATLKVNDRAEIMKNTYDLNETLHELDIDEKLRSQFVGTCLLYIKDRIKHYYAGNEINEALADKMTEFWRQQSSMEIQSGIKSVLEGMLSNSKNKDKKIELLQKNILENQKVRNLKIDEWIRILRTLVLKIYKYIDANTNEGQDILNLFFITFNKYVGKADKNQAFTPDHITHFMTLLTDVNRESRVLDITCGSGSFLVQAMVQQFADCRRNTSEQEAKVLIDMVKKEHIYGIESEEMAYGLSTTNMLIHGDGNSNIELGSCFDKRDFIKNAHPSVVLMNPPYNAKPRSIPDEYKTSWKKDLKEDPTKGLVFVQYLSDIAKESGWIGTKLAVLLPMSVAIGSSKIISDAKKDILEKNTLEAVFSLPAEIFYPGASVQACCMLFTLNQAHFGEDGKPNKQTFFGYYKEDGFKKKKNLGRVEQFDADGHSKWKTIEKEWLDLYKNKIVKAGLSAMQAVTGDDEWLCEAYMKTDYSKLTEADFQKTINDYLAYLVKNGKVTS